MIVVAIIGLLAAIAIPKFAGLVVKAREASIKGALGSVRSAMSIYYADNEGRYPSAGGTGTGTGSAFTSWWLYPKYLDTAPMITIPGYANHANRDYVASELAMMFPDGGMFVAWYVPLDPTMSFLTGEVHVMCTHTDSSGRTWSLW